MFNMNDFIFSTEVSMLNMKRGHSNAGISLVNMKIPKFIMQRFMSQAENFMIHMESFMYIMQRSRFIMEIETFRADAE
jgi:hypothetical protein